MVFWCGYGNQTSLEAWRLDMVRATSAFCHIEKLEWHSVANLYALCGVFVWVMLIYMAHCMVLCAVGNFSQLTANDVKM